MATKRTRLGRTGALVYVLEMTTDGFRAVGGDVLGVWVIRSFLSGTVHAFDFTTVK